MPALRRMRRSALVQTRDHGKRVRTRARLKMAWSIASATRAGPEEIQNTFASPSHRKEECKKTSHAAAQRRNAGPGFRCAATPPREKTLYIRRPIMKSHLSIAALIVLSAALLANAQTIEKKALTIDGAKKVITAAVAYAKKNNAPGGVIAVVDEGGNLMALERLDGTFAAGANISIGKARTSVLFKKPTKVFEDIIKNGRTAMVALPDAFFTPLQGGIPIIVEGQIVGGVGVSGASSAQQDEELAVAGANVFAEAQVSY